MDTERLAVLRKQAHCTQEKVGEALGIDQRRYCSYESGKREPCHEMLCALADYFNVSVDYLLGRDEKKAPPQVAGLALSCAEQEIIKDYRKCTEREQGRIEGYVYALAERHHAREDKQK